MPPWTNQGEPAWARPLGDRRIVGAHSLPECSGMAWSADGAALALLLDGEEARRMDGHSGDLLGAFSAPAAPMPPGLPEWYTRRQARTEGYRGDLLWVGDQHILRLAPHFVDAYTPDGKRVAAWVVPVDPAPAP